MKKLLRLFPILCCSLLVTQPLQAQHQNATQTRTQTPHEHHECASHATTGQVQYMNQTIRERQTIQADRTGTIYLPVRHIIVRRSDGTGGISNAALDNAMNELNATYAAANMNFYECSRTYLNNDTYFDFSTNEEAALAGLTEVSNVINVFHCNTVTNAAGTASYCGYAYFPGGSDRIVMKNSCTTNGSTFIHEFGHYFSLYHTHQSGNELVDGSNCTTAGDQICDTPADPNVSGQVNGSCVYTGSATDANGDAYNPPTTNFMSYSRKSCRVEFTDGQIARARYSAMNDRSYLTCSCYSYDYVGAHNFGTDVSSNNYATSANVYTTTVYNCDGDANQLRVGSCSSAPNTGGDYVSVEFDVPAGTDKLRLLLRGGWQNNHAEVHIDGQYQRDFTMTTASCSTSYTYVYIYNISNHTQDGRVQIKLVDPEPGCTGDFNIDQMYVYAANCNQSGYAKVPYFTNFNSGVLDDYWLTQSSNEFGRAELTNANGPYSGAYHLVMDVNTNNRYATNQADLRVDLSNCPSATLYFRWKEFNDETHAEDGVYISDDGGETFAKVFDLTGGTYNTWASASLDLSALASANSMNLTEEFIIRFQQYDNFGATTDGIAIDHVYVYGCNNIPTPPFVAMVNDDIAKGQILTEFPGWDNAVDDPQGQVTAVENLANGAAIDVFPNPASTLLHVNFSGFTTDERLTVRVVDLLGAIQFSTTHTVSNTKSDVMQLAIEQLPVGMYSVVIEGQQGILRSQRFVKE